ncbi:elicitin [Phytophthora sojae]|uniref:Elicitin n=2 Tax=Phytophthora sojae TaxID=67593 RepID=G4ZXG9_PHYSP|nr:elicitin [Phytophthora sojae]AAO24641.1 elicitin protein [Phytophthora sojae]ABB55993.1 putative elicitin protein SOJ2B [Phytophthora sojae]EGZ11832.1 elicitin [Phytophthora sojae]|eukprot:XP_009532165.1 elicitin [Phytophthora sojae]
MNTKTFLAVAAAAFVGSAVAETCSSTDQTSAYSSLASVLTLSSFQGCADESGFSLLYSTSLPDDAQYEKMCASDNCKSLIESVAALNPPDCDLTVPTSGLVLNVVDLTSGFSTKCSSLSSTSTSTTSTASSAATATTTEAPAATTAAPATESATTESATVSAATEAPAATPAATTPTTEASNSTTSVTQTATAC